MKKLWVRAVVLFLACAVQGFLPAEGDDGLVLHLPLNEGEGAKALDISGKGNHGEISEPEWAEDTLRGEGYVLNLNRGRIPGALAGASVRVPHDESLSLEDEITLAAWIKINEYGGYYATHILRKFIAVENLNYAWYIFGNHQGANRQREGVLRLKAYVGGRFTAITPSHKLSPGRWYHAAATYHKEKGGQLYINGMKVSDQPMPAQGKLPVNEADVWIAAGDRLQSDLRVYNRALSEEEIMELVESYVAESVQLISLEGAYDDAKVIGEEENIRVVDGRIEGVKAAYLEECGLKWDLDIDLDFFIEYWMKPSGWDALTQEDIEIAVFRAGGTDYRIYKCGQESRLVLEGGGKILSLYPVYSWSEQKLMDVADESEKWRYINLTFSGESVNFSVNGFPAHVVLPAAGGALEEFRLKGSEGTFFSELRIVPGGIPEGELMLRYLYMHRDFSAPMVLRPGVN